MVKINEEVREALSWFSFSARFALDSIEEINDFQAAASKVSWLTDGRFDDVPCLQEEKVDRLLQELNAVDECVSRLKNILNSKLETENK